MNNIIEIIKRELKEGEVLEDIDIESVDESQEYEINRPRNRKMKGSLLKKGALALALAMTLNGPIIQKNNDNISVVEAATKDKKKPKITMKGKSKITVNQNEAIKLGKVTAKDNIDGNVTKKITVKVTKGKKNYSSIAKKAKANKKIKFTVEGTYVVTYTVKDKAGNKTTKKRYITVKPIMKTILTEEKTQELITTEQPVEEVPTTEMSTTTIETTTEEPIVEEWMKYNIDNNEEFSQRITSIKYDDSITFNIENNYYSLLLDRNAKIFDNLEFLKYFGKITAYDRNGNDISDNIVISIYDLETTRIIEGTQSASFYIYVKDKNGNEKAKTINIFFTDFKNVDYEGYILIDEENGSYAHPFILDNAFFDKNILKLKNNA